MNRFLATLIAFLLLTTNHASAADAPTPPAQPASGPGGLEAPFVPVRSDRFGWAPTGFSLFWPEAPIATEPLPVVVFVHGFSAVNPDTYRGWIEHIVRRGAIVIYPDYQTGNFLEVPPSAYQANAVAGIQAAVTMLDESSPLPADTKRLAIVGHSLGGVLALNIAAIAASVDLPAPVVVMSVEPGGCYGCGGLSELLGVPFADLSRIDPATLAMLIVGDQDEVVADTGAKLAWQAMTSIPFEQRDYVILRTDRRGAQDLIADHFAPETGSGNGEIDALDWFGYWKWLDLLTECAFAGTGCEDALGGSAVQLDMGEWSDGTPVIEPLITDRP